MTNNHDNFPEEYEDLLPNYDELLADIEVRVIGNCFPSKSEMTVSNAIYQIKELRNEMNEKLKEALLRIANDNGSNFQSKSRFLRQLVDLNNTIYFDQINEISRYKNTATNKLNN